MASPLIIEEPALIIAGVQKGGTTTVFNILADHPAFSPAKYKESHFFAQTDELIKEQFEWYRNLYTRSGILLDASTSYFANPNAPRRILKHFKKPKVLILLRDPAERAFSGYLQTAKQLPRIERRTFDEILEGINHSNHPNLLEKEREANTKALQSGKLLRPFFGKDHYRKRNQASFDAQFDDEMWVHHYVGESCYDLHLPRWEEAFGSDLLVQQFEDFIEKPDVVVKEITSFLEVDVNLNELHLNRKDNTTALIEGPSGRFLGNINSKLSHGKLGSLKKSIGRLGFKALYRKTMRTFSAPKPKLNDGQRMQLDTLLSKSFEHLKTTM